MSATDEQTLEVIGHSGLFTCWRAWGSQWSKNGMDVAIELAQDAKQPMPASSLNCQEPQPGAHKGAAVERERFDQISDTVAVSLR